MRVGYFINQYPAATYTFIRREIRAMEALGVSAFRYALRTGDHKSVDPEDEIEEKLTKHILRAGIGEILRCCVTALLTQPVSLARAIRDGFILGWRSDRGILRNLNYVVEAAVLASLGVAATQYSTFTHTLVRTPRQLRCLRSASPEYPTALQFTGRKSLKKLNCSSRLEAGTRRICSLHKLVREKPVNALVTA